MHFWKLFFYKAEVCSKHESVKVFFQKKLDLSHSKNETSWAVIEIITIMYFYDKISKTTTTSLSKNNLSLRYSF